MSRRNFAKKLVAYSMAFAVAFSTITVSPVFVKEAKAASAVTITKVGSEKFAQPGADTGFAGLYIVGDMYSSLATTGTGDKITLAQAAKYIGVKPTEVAGTIVNNVITTQDVSNPADTDETFTITDAKVKEVAFNNVKRNNAGLGTVAEKLGNLKFEYVSDEDGAKWYKLISNNVEVDYTVGTATEKLTIPYYSLEAFTAGRNTNNTKDAIKFEEVNADQIGTYVAISGKKVVDALVIEEGSDMYVEPNQGTVYAMEGQNITIGMDATSSKAVTYKWTKNGKELGTAATLKLNNVSEFGTYSCKVSDGIKSTTKTVTVSPASKATTAQKGTATAINTNLNILDSDNLQSESVTVTTSIPKNDNYVYVWDFGTGSEYLTSVVSSNDLMEYDASAREITITDKTFKTSKTNFDGKVIKVYALDKTTFNNTYYADIKAINDAKAYDKLDAIETLVNKVEDVVEGYGDASLYFFKEVITLGNEVVAPNSDTSEVIVKNVTDELVLNAPDVTNVPFDTTPALTYTWTKGGSITPINPKKVTKLSLGIGDFGTYKCTVTGNVNGNSTTVSHTYNVVYQSDLTAKGTDLNVKVGTKNVELVVDAKASLPIDYSSWTPTEAVRKTMSGLLTVTDQPNKRKIAEVKANDIFVPAVLNEKGEIEKAATQYHTCNVTDGVVTIPVTFKITEKQTFTVAEDKDNNGAETINITAVNGRNVTLAPTVNKVDDSEITYAWTKNGSSKVLSTDASYTFEYDNANQSDSYSVTITDGTKKVVLTYEFTTLTTVTAKGTDFTGTTSAVKYTGEALDGGLVVSYTYDLDDNPLTTNDLSTIVLKKDVDYTVEYAENVNVGTARYTVTFIGVFKDVDGKLTGTFPIDRADNEVKLADVTANVGGNVKPVATDLANAPMTIKFYADKELTKEVTEATVKAKAGTYYAQASAIATANYNAAKSNVATIVVKGLGTTSKLSVTKRTSTTMTVKYAKVANAAGYRIYVKNVKTNYAWKVVANTTALTYKVTGLPAGYNTAVAVRAYDAKKVLAPKYASVTKRTAPGTTSKVTITTGRNSAKLTWNKVTGATTYRVYVKKAGKWTALTTTKSNTFTKSGLKRRTTYTFAVRAYNSTDKLWADKYVAKSAKTK